MNSIPAWIQHVGEGDPSIWRALTLSLRQHQVDACEDPDRELPHLLLLDGVTDVELEAVATQRQQRGSPILAICRRRADLGQRGVWRLLRAGADDVFVVEELEDPAAAISARLQRIAEVEEVLNSP